MLFQYKSSWSSCEHAQLDHSLCTGSTNLVSLTDIHVNSLHRKPIWLQLFIIPSYEHLTAARSRSCTDDLCNVHLREFHHPIKMFRTNNVESFQLSEFGKQRFDWLTKNIICTDLLRAAVDWIMKSCILIRLTESMHTRETFPWMNCFHTPDLISKTIRTAINLECRTWWWRRRWWWKWWKYIVFNDTEGLRCKLSTLQVCILRNYNNKNQLFAPTEIKSLVLFTSVSDFAISCLQW